MRAWLWMLGGLVVWAAHFVGLYALASLADVAARADDPAFRVAGAAFSLLCLAAAVLIGWKAAALARRHAREDRWPHELALGAAGVGAISVAWQSLPLIVGH